MHALIQKFSRFAVVASVLTSLLSSGPSGLFSSATPSWAGELDSGRRDIAQAVETENSRGKANATTTAAAKAGNAKAGNAKAGGVKSTGVKSEATSSGGGKASGLKGTVGKSGESKARRLGGGEAGPAVTPEREAAVLKFVEQHHPELVGLLESLKAKNSAEYEHAVRDLFRVSERLAQYYGRDAKRYDLELRLWQSQSRIDLLAARFKMSSNEDLRTQIRQALDEHFSLRQLLMQLERDRAADRLKKLDEQLQTFDTSREDLLDRQFRLLLGKQKAGSTKEQ